VMLGVRCDEKHLLWHFVNQTEQTVPVHGDHTKLRQILINLLGNAVKFTQRGSVTLALSSPAKGCYCFEVIDTGIGIDVAQQQAIFAAFGQTVQGIKAGGTGLGLAIASRQVKLMGGQLQLSSAINQGSRFFFTVALPSAHQAIQTSQQRAKREFKIAPGITINALVVDDLRENRDALCQMLQHIGLSVTESNTGEEALVLLQRADNLPEFVFIDIRMPVMDGVNTMQAIGQLFNQQNKKPACIAVTANAMQQDIDSCLNLGFDHYITKPFRFSTLCDAIVRFMPPDLAHQIEQTQPTDQPAIILDLSSFDMPPLLYQALTEAADVYEVSKLEVALEKLASLSPQGQQMADKLGHYITNYDMDGLLVELEKVNVATQDCTVEKSTVEKSTVEDSEDEE
ncbi:MAG: response regulator, partial [Algicola sp.]|nr:response regulator [Algicola sp.]